MWCIWWLGMENKWECDGGGRGFHCLMLIGQAWRHFPWRLPPPSSTRPALIIPPSICVHLDRLLNSCYTHHNRSLCFSVSYLNLEEKNSVLVFCFLFFFACFVYFPSSLHSMDAYMELLLSVSSCSPSSLPPLPPPSPLLSWLAIFFSQHPASFYNADLFNGAAHGSC